MRKCAWEVSVMLEKRRYSRSELIEIFKTSRLDAIKAKIRRAGYVFTDSGWGSSYSLEILDLPGEDLFKRYCVDQLRFAPQTDFQKLKHFLFFFLENEEFMTLQYNQMAQVMIDHGIHITAQTISGYFQHLKSIGWVFTDSFDYVYFLYDEALGETRYISKEEYCAINKEFWQLRKIQHYSWSEAYAAIKKKYGNKPRKRPLELKTAFFLEQYKAVWDLIDNEIKENNLEG